MSTRKFPRRNLPPDSEMWGRDVESRMQALENASDDDLQNGNTNRTLNLITQQINTLTETQTALAQQQAVLTQIVTAQQLVLRSTSFLADAFGVSNTSFASKTVGGIPVPAGSTSVLVVGAVSFRVTKPTSTTSDVYVENRMVINGNISTLPSSILTGGMTVGNSAPTGGTFSQWLPISGISDVGLDFQTQSSSPYGGLGYVMVTATAMFFRNSLF